MVKECALSTGNLPWGGLLRNIVDRITDRLDMTSAVDHGRKASLQPNQTLLKPFIYPTKKKRNSKIFPLSFPFNAKMLIVIKYLVLIKSRQNSSVA